MGSRCTGCYSGCVDITSDQCVKYTGANVSALGIETGDSLASVEAAITSYLLTVISGVGIVPTIEPSYICTIVDGYLPSSPTLVDILTALVRTACDLQTQITANADAIETLNDTYTIGTCLSGVTVNSDTHDIVQAVINKLCSISGDVTALASNFSNYVKISEINTYIATYLAGISTSNKMYTKMVPYVAVEYYGTLTGRFDLTGAGIVGSDWEKIYLCNGQNGTPDKRGRIPVGATTMGSSTFDPVVDPGISGNPTYALNTTEGANTVALAVTEMPAHTHTATVVINDPGHTHTFTSSEDDEATSPGPYVLASPDEVSIDLSVDPALTGLDGTNVIVTNSISGTGVAHNNIPPVRACYYIMYIP